MLQVLGVLRILKMGIDIRGLQSGDIAAITSTDGGNGWNPSRTLWDQYLSEQQTDARRVMVAWNGTQPMGYGTLVWRSEYEPFRSQDIPEINNLSTACTYRNRGVATAIIDVLEAAAREAGKTKIGLGVGLYADYGDAQRLYTRLGYCPDGRGVTYQGRFVEPGHQVQLDDDLILWLSKALSQIS